MLRYTRMYHIFFIHPSAHEHFGCFHVLANVNKDQIAISNHNGLDIYSPEQTRGMTQVLCALSMDL